MNAQVVPFRPAKPKPIPTAAELVARVRALAAKSDNIGFDHPHFQERMTKRGITMRQILETIRKGECISGPTKDEWGDWRIKLRRHVAGRRVQIVTAVKEDRLEAVTAI